MWRSTSLMRPWLAGIAGLDPCDPANMPYFWHKGRDFIKDGTPVHLIFRMATVGEAGCCT